MKAKHTVRFTALLVLFIAFATGGRLYAQDADWGDAPDQPYPTLSGSGGAVHQIMAGFHLGTAIDPEANGQPNANATGDDLAGTPDDEDGVNFPQPLIPGQPAQFNVWASQPGFLYIWIDFDLSGMWGDNPNEYFTGPLAAGNNTVNITIPASAILGPTYARFRFTSGPSAFTGGAPSPSGSAGDGEVEDYLVTIEREQGGLDFGDAPDPTYPTLAANNGARHGIVANLYLGASIDSEPDGQPDPVAFGDDADILYPPPNDDEDGVVFTSLAMQGAPLTLTVTAVGSGLLDAWVDFNQDGTWAHPGEQVFNSVLLSPGPNSLIINVPASATIGQTFVRFRFSSNGGLAPTGLAPDGEVEDYELWIESDQIDPHKMHYPQYPDPDGWDVRACYAQYDDEYKVLADDFLCTSNGLITRITFWGSWENDNFIVEDPMQGINKIHLSLHADIPDQDENGPDYSKPEVPALWERDLDLLNLPLGWTVQDPVPEEPSDQGWYDPNIPEYMISNHVQYFRYDIDIPEDDAFYQTNGTIYWLDISVETEFGLWGWKTSRSPHFNDDAVWGDMPIDDPSMWHELREPTIYSNSLDLAFIIDGPVEEPPPALDWGDLPDSYNTLAANNGANHTTGQTYYMGTLVDAESDGQPTAAADGDDLNNLADEDGVTFNTPFVPGQSAQFDVTVSALGQLDIWMDINGDGAWTLPLEHVFTGGVAGGLNPLSFTVPLGTPAGGNYLRYRFTSSPSAYPSGAPTPTGNASDGEVEDYAINIDDPIDWGDAPDGPYPTLAISGGANHLIAQGIFLGASVDAELDGQPDPQALGDDQNLIYPGVPYPLGDEDGVGLPSPLIPGTTQLYTVFASSPALLNAWIDFNGNGSWLDPGEQIHTDTPLVIGLNNFGLSTPSTAVAGPTFARFRYSSVAGLLPTGFASDGEVEDYLVDILEPQEIDWGDAPDALQSPYYPTLMVNNGAHHVIIAGMFLGNLVDPELDGQPDPNAMGDDNDLLYPSLGDDEDGVILTSLLMPGGIATVNVIASQPGVLDAWIDFGNDGSWSQPGDQIFGGQPLNPGINSLTFPVPSILLIAPTNSPAYSRWRYTIGGAPTYTGLAMNGEVEDHEFMITGIDGDLPDFGDAPNTYPTLLPGGASHTIKIGVMLGATIDSEANGQPTATANGDDTTGIDDEDGVAFISKIVAGSNATITVVAGVSGGNLDAWIDFNADGDWMDTGEQIFASQPVIGGVNNLSFTVPQPTALGLTFARFRISTGGSLGPGGAANDGEVEDYTVDLYQPIPTNLVITNLTFNASNTVATVEWTAQSSIIYQMQATTNLMSSNSWADVEATVLGPLNSQTNNMVAETNKFYRITVPWTP